MWQWLVVTDVELGGFVKARAVDQVLGVLILLKVFGNFEVVVLLWALVERLDGRERPCGDFDPSGI